MSISSLLSAGSTASTIGDMEGMLTQQRALASENMHATMVSGQLSAEQSLTKGVANVMTSGANAVASAAGQSH